ncbi:SPOR domain-containing protein, partial [Stenotrophomonas koreensis]
WSSVVCSSDLRSGGSSRPESAITSSLARASGPMRWPPATPPRPSVPAANTPAATPAPKPAATVAKPQPAPAPATPRAPAASAVGWVVQLGAFSNAAEAEALRERMRAAGFSAFVEQVPTDRGSLSRVRVGPVASREAAEQLKAQLAARTGSSGMVRQHP